MAKLTVATFADTIEAQAFYLAQVDAIASQAQEHQTSADRETIHSLKYAEAASFSARAKTPWIDAEAKALGKTRKQVAESILEARRSWQDRMVEVESARVRAKLDIRQATSAAEAQQAVARFRKILKS